MPNLKLTPAKLKKLLIEHDDGVLKHGSHHNGEREFCAMEFIAKVAGEPWTDHPKCVHPALGSYCRQLNDSTWPSDNDRTETMLPLLAEVFGTADLKISVARIAEGTTKIIVPIALRHAASVTAEPHKAKLLAAAERCEKDGTEAAANAANAAAYAANAANAAAYAANAAANAAYAAAYAANAAAYAANAAYAAAYAANAANAAAYAAERLKIYAASIAIVIAEIKRARSEAKKAA